MKLLELGCDLGPSPTELYMANVSGLKLKWARSPPRPALPLEMAWGSEPPMCREFDGDLSKEQRKVGSIGSPSLMASEGDSALSLVSGSPSVTLATGDGWC